MRVAIYGAGAMGTVLGAFITKNGGKVDLITRNKEHVAVLREGGAHITGTVDFTVPVSALLPEEMEGRYDIIFLMTKQRHNAEILDFLLPFLSDGGVVCTTQNGLPEPSVAEVVGEERCCGCAVSWGATFVGRGEAKLTTRPDGLEFALGTLYKNTGKLAAVASVLSLMDRVRTESNFIGARWSKLAINCAFSGLSAISGLTYGQICDDKYARKVAQAILNECFCVARACGIRPGRVQGHDVAKILGYRTALKRRISYALIPVAMKKHRALVSGMYYDLKAGRVCETDLVNGVVSRYGARVCAPARLNELVQEIAHEIERGERKIMPENIKEFEKYI